MITLGICFLPFLCYFGDPLNLKVLGNNIIHSIMFTVIILSILQMREVSLREVFQFCLCFLTCLNVYSKSVAELGLKPTNGLISDPACSHYTVIPL